MIATKAFSKAIRLFLSCGSTIPQIYVASLKPQNDDTNQRKIESLAYSKKLCLNHLVAKEMRQKASLHDALNRHRESALKGTVKNNVARSSSSKTVSPKANRISRSKKSTPIRASHHANHKQSITPRSSESNSLVIARKSASLSGSLSVTKSGDTVEKQADAMAARALQAKNTDTINTNNNYANRITTAPSDTNSPSNFDASSIKPTKSLVHKAITGGQPLSKSERQFFEPRFGHDFSSVRVHNDASAHQSAAQMGAKAYTYGNHIVFNKDRYQDGSQATQTLMAHELAHVVQQEKLGAKREIARAVDPAAQEAVVAISNLTGPWQTEQDYVNALLAAASRADLSKPDNIRAITDAVKANSGHYGPRVLVSFLAQVDSTLPNRNTGIQWSAAQAQHQQTIRLMQVKRNAVGTYGGVLIPHLAGAVATPLRAIFEALGNLFESAGAFIQGIFRGLVSSIGPKEAELISKRLLESQVLTAVFPVVFMSGAAVGVVEDIVGAIKGIIDTISNLNEMAAAALEVMRLLFSSDGPAFARKLGTEIGGNFGQKIVRLAKGNVFEFSFGLGRMIGPMIIYTVLAFLGVPQALASSAITRIMAIIKPFLDKLPRLKRLLRRRRRNGSDSDGGSNQQREISQNQERSERQNSDSNQNQESPQQRRRGNPLDDPKVAKEVKADPNAIYGYSLKPSSPLAKFGIDFSDAAQVASARAKRIKYLENLAKKRKALEAEVRRLRAEGHSMKSIAESKVAKRNQDRINSYIESNNLEGLESMYQRNLQNYGRREGPTAEQLFEKKGSWERVVFGSVETSRAMNVVLGLD